MLHELWRRAGMGGIYNSFVVADIRAGRTITAYDADMVPQQDDFKVSLSARGRDCMCIGGLGLGSPDALFALTLTGL